MVFFTRIQGVDYRSCHNQTITTTNPIISVDGGNAYKTSYSIKISAADEELSTTIQAKTEALGYIDISLSSASCISWSSICCFFMGAL